MSLTLNDLWYAWLQTQLPAGVVAGTSIPIPGSQANAGAPIDNSVSAFAVVTGNNTSAGNAIATIAAGSLPAGMYQIDIYSQTPVITNPSIPDNVELRAGATSVVRVQLHIVAQNAPSTQPKTPLTVYRRLDGATALSLNFIANFAATETQEWHCTLVATRRAL